jgi:hypothetical protein
MIRLAVLGPDTQLLSTTCAACPHNAAGCCVSPPPHGWSDVGRLVLDGGREFVLSQLAARNLVPAARGLAVRRVRGRNSIQEPRQNKCVYHGAQGCTIASTRRPSTCNYYLCEEAYLDAGERSGEPDAVKAREAQSALAAQYARWNRELAEAIEQRWPEGPGWDGEFLDWLADELAVRTGMLARR